jgi:hypothetical protein
MDRIDTQYGPPQTSQEPERFVSPVIVQPAPWRRLLPAFMAIGGMIFGGVLVGVTGTRSGHSSASRNPSPSPPAAVTTPSAITNSSSAQTASTPQATMTATVTATMTTTVTVPPQPLAQLGDGTYLVPTQARPGTWSTNGVSTISASLLGCYWARLRSTSGEMSAVIASQNLAQGAPTTITVERTDKAVKFSGGCAWREIE